MEKVPAQAWGADCVVVEKNQGGDMATSVLKTADPALPVRPVHARYGKGDRAEPVAMLFETGKARFAGGSRAPSPSWRTSFARWSRAGAMPDAARPTGPMRWCGR
ncbi:MAG TPA: hypothetical protein VE891_00335 [Allosphingosinicella sp.]|nr:hypothetical protein [Allosphingosinicella sp.]